MKILRVLAGTALVSGIMATGSIEAKDDKGDCEDPKAALSGFYVSAGGGYSSQKSRVDVEGIVEYLSPITLVSDGGYALDEPDYVNNGYTVTGDDASGLTASKRIRIRGAERNTHKMNGAVALGGGRFVGSFYLGVEAGLEVGNSGGAVDKKTVIPGEAIGPGAPDLNVYYRLKNNGVVPCLRLKLGGFSNLLNGMFYALVGVNRVKATLSGYKGYAESGFSLTKLTPSIGFGFEKVIKNKMSIKFEGDYKLKSSKTGSILAPGDDGNFLKVKQKIKTDGFAVRVMANWHF
jgi:hypothetical protein